MDELLKQGSLIVINLAIDLEQDMNKKVFCDKMVCQKINGRPPFKDSTRTVMRYLHNEKEAGKDYDMFFKYSSNILGISQNFISHKAKYYKDNKDRLSKDELISNIKSSIKLYINYRNNDPIPRIELIEFDEMSSFALYEFLIEAGQDEQQRLNYLYYVCFNGFSYKMREFLSTYKQK